MAQVEVKYRSVLARLTGKDGETVDASSVRDVLRYIAARYGEDAQKTAKAMLITINGESILRFKIYKTALGEGDILAFFPVCGGG